MWPSFLRSIRDDIFSRLDRLPSPIGINVFFSEDAFHVLTSEVKWIWFPTITGFFIIRGLLYVRSAQLAVKQAREDRPAPCADTGVPYGRYLCNSPRCEISTNTLEVDWFKRHGKGSMVSWIRHPS